MTACSMPDEVLKLMLGKIDRLSPSEKTPINMEELIKLQEQYIQLLIAELEEVVPIAHIHGWRTSRFEEGELIRQKMKEQKAVLTVPDRVAEKSTTIKT